MEGTQVLCQNYSNMLPNLTNYQIPDILINCFPCRRFLQNTQLFCVCVAMHNQYIMAFRLDFPLVKSCNELYIACRNEGIAICTLVNFKACTHGWIKLGGGGGEYPGSRTPPPPPLLVDPEKHVSSGGGGGGTGFLKTA